ncbi:hypothetical protein PM082_007163 [Marasmius tenuissimus]|nr:hypothetical protein PM082_007163 [Marasmius tenuissimus]
MSDKSVHQGLESRAPSRQSASELVSEPEPVSEKIEGVIESRAEDHARNLDKENPAHGQLDRKPKTKDSNKRFIVINGYKISDIAPDSEWAEWLHMRADEKGFDYHDHWIVVEFGVEALMELDEIEEGEIVFRGQYRAGSILDSRRASV